MACAAQKFGTFAMGLSMAEENRDQILARWTAATNAAKPHQGNGPSPDVPNEKGGRTMTRKLSRRHVLHGAGVALSLPWLEAMVPSGRLRAATTAPIKRFMTIYFPNGASTLWWKTTGSGKGDAWKLSPLLSPFEPLKAKMLMIRQLGNFTWRSDLLTMNPAWTTYRERNDFCGVCRMPSGAFVLPSHSRAPSALLNCIDGDDYRRAQKQDIATSSANGETVDQLIARSLPQTALRSMQLGLFNGTGGLDERHSAMSRNLSWSQQGTPLGKDLEPATIFDKLVATGAGQSGVDATAAAEAERRRALDLSVLDALKQSTTTLQQRLGKERSRPARSLSDRGAGARGHDPEHHRGPARTNLQGHHPPRQRQRRPGAHAGHERSDRHGAPV